MATYVDYSNQDDEGVSVARLVRLYNIWHVGKAIGGKNIAVVYVKAGHLNTHNLAVFASSNPSDRVHSEPAVMARLGQFVANRYELKGEQQVQNQINFLIGSGAISWLYTERAPCEKGPGMANCAGFLAQHYPKLPVSYSFQYPSGGKEEMDNLLKIHSDLGIIDEEGFLSIKQYYLEIGKKERAEVTEALKAFDKTFTKMDDMNQRQLVGKKLELLLAKRGLVIC